MKRKLAAALLVLSLAVPAFATGRLAADAPHPARSAENSPCGLRAQQVVHELAQRGLQVLQACA